MTLMLLSPSSEEVDFLEDHLLIDADQHHELLSLHDQQDLSYLEAAKNHLKYILPFIPANTLITGSTLVSGKLLSNAGGQVIAALPYIYGFYGLTQCANTLFVGTGVSAANAQGEGDIGQINSILKLSMMIAVGLSIPYVTMIYQGGNISRLIGAPNDVAEVVQTHLNQFGWGVPFYYVNGGLSHTTLPFGTAPTSVNLVANAVVSSALSFLFTKGVGFISPMPIAGTALALSVTSVLNDLGFFGYMLSQPKYRKIMANNTDYPSLRTFKKIMNVGLPTALNTLSQMASGLVATTTISALLNETALQQHGLTIMPMAFLQTLIASNGDAAAVLISNHVGAGKYSAVNKQANTAHAFGVLSGVLGSALIASLAGPYIRYFSDPAIATPEFVSTTRNLLLLSSLNQTISSVGVTATGALKGIDENWKPQLINSGLKLGLNLLGSSLLMYGTNLGVYSPYVSDLIVSSLFYTPSLYYYCKNKIASYTNQAVQEDLESNPSLGVDDTQGGWSNPAEIPLEVERKEEQQPSATSSRSFLGWLYPNSRTSSSAPSLRDAEPLREEVQQSELSTRRRWFFF